MVTACKLPSTQGMQMLHEGQQPRVHRRTTGEVDQQLDKFIANMWPSTYNGAFLTVSQCYHPARGTARKPCMAAAPTTNLQLADFES
jgi:hypothetical protein